MESGYWSQESQHFLVRYEGGGGIDVGRSVTDNLERAYESLGRDFGVYPKERVQVGIYVTKTFAELGGIPPEFAEHVLGFYDFQKLRLRLSASQAGSIGLERLVRHEYAHLLIHQATNGNAPRWLHEGLAQVAEPRSAPRLDRDGRRPGPSAVHARRAGASVPLERRRGGVPALAHRLRVSSWIAAACPGSASFSPTWVRGEPIAEALKEGLGVSVEDVEARLLAAGGRS